MKTIILIWCITASKCFADFAVTIYIQNVSNCDVTVGWAGYAAIGGNVIPGNGYLVTVPANMTVTEVGIIPYSGANGSYTLGANVGGGAISAGGTATVSADCGTGTETNTTTTNGINFADYALISAKSKDGQRHLYPVKIK